MSTTRTDAEVQDDLRTMFYRAFEMAREAEDRDEYDPDFEVNLVKMFEDEGHDMAEIGRYLLSGFLDGEIRRGFVFTGHEVQTFNTTADFNR